MFYQPTKRFANEIRFKWINFFHFLSIIFLCECCTKRKFSGLKNSLWPSAVHRLTDNEPMWNSAIRRDSNVLSLDPVTHRLLLACAFPAANERIRVCVCGNAYLCVCASQKTSNFLCIRKWISCIILRWKFFGLKKSVFVCKQYRAVNVGESKMSKSRMGPNRGKHLLFSGRENNVLSFCARMCVWVCASLELYNIHTRLIDTISLCAHRIMYTDILSTRTVQVLIYRFFVIRTHREWIW